MRVRNLQGTATNTCNCASWLDHWKLFAGTRQAPKCSVSGCLMPAQVGAHVQRTFAWDNKWYIVPMCTSHNQQYGQELEIRDDVQLIDANVAETCGDSFKVAICQALNR